MLTAVVLYSVIILQTHASLLDEYSKFLYKTEILERWELIYTIWSELCREQYTNMWLGIDINRKFVLPVLLNITTSSPLVRHLMSVMSTPDTVNHFFEDLTLCMGALSCWNSKQLSTNCCHSYPDVIVYYSRFVFTGFKGPNKPKCVSKYFWPCIVSTSTLNIKNIYIYTHTK